MLIRVLKRVFIIPFLVFLTLSILPVKSKEIVLDGWGTITTEKELFNILECSKKMNKAVVLLVAAHWCTSCKELENLTLTDPRVIKLLVPYNKVLLDVTDIEKTKLLLKKYKLIGPPAILFFDKSGKEREERVIGYISSTEFKELLEEIG